MINSDGEYCAWPLVAWALAEVKVVGRIAPDNPEFEVVGIYACLDTLELCQGDMFVRYLHEDELKKSDVKLFYEEDGEEQG